MDHAVNRSMLTDLIDTCSKGARGFALAARDNREPGITAVLKDGEESSRIAAAELQEQIRLMGEEAADVAVASGHVYRGWTDFNAVAIALDTKLILEECERGADYARGRYEVAMKLELPESVRAVVHRQYERVVAIQGRLRLLRIRYPATATLRGRDYDSSSGQRLE